MRIKKEVLKEIKRNHGLRGRLCTATGKSYPTIQRWVEDNDQGLTLAAALQVIREELNLTDSQILEEESKTAA